MATRSASGRPIQALQPGSALLLPQSLPACSLRAPVDQRAAPGLDLDDDLDDDDPGDEEEDEEDEENGPDDADEEDEDDGDEPETWQVLPLTSLRKTA
jgi:hypothetical protein